MATGQPWAKPVDLPGFNQPCGLGIEFLCHILVVKMAEIAGQNKQQFFLHLRYNVINHGGDSLWRGVSNHQRQYLRASKVPADKRQLGFSPVIFLEYALNFAAACRVQDIKNVAVTAGYISDAPREEFFGAMDAANIDLKGFTERFYKKLTKSEIQPVLETIAYLVQETSCWVELTTLLIPGENDNPKEIKALSR